MKLKRVYHQDKLVRDKDSRVLEVKPGAVAGIHVLRADRGVQRFTTNVIDGGIAEGWLAMGDGRLTIRQLDGPPIVYRIIRTPGHYCCHDDAPIADAGRLVRGKTVGQLYVEERFAGAPSPDPSNPAGYRRDNFYTCVNERRDERNLDHDAAVALEAALRNALAAKIGEKHRCKARLPRLVPGTEIVAADFVFNIAKGRAAELYNRVDTNDGANSALIIIVIDANGDTDATMKDRDEISALLGGTANEVTNTNYARKTLTDSDLAAFAPDDTNDRVDLDVADQSWTGVAAGDAWTDLIVAYDNDTTGGNDTNVVPLTLHDFAVTPDGSDITAQIASAGFFRAS